MGRDQDKKSTNSWLREGVTRRRFLQVSGAVGAGAAFLKTPFARAASSSSPDPEPGGATIVRSGCMMCNAGCGIQVRVKDGVAVKIDGNPFCPHTNDYAAAGTYAAASDLPNADNDPGMLCPRGQAGLMTLYDPQRLRTPLKRTGPRGSGQWEAISWEQAVREIVWGGSLPEGSFVGLAAIRDVTNKFTNADTAFGAEAKGGLPANYGYKSNQLLMVVGRDQNSAATGRFMTAFGSVNRIDHTSICNASYKLSGYVTFVKDDKDKGTFDFKPDYDGADYLLLFGTNPLEANVTNPQIRKSAAFAKRGGRMVVVDPRFSNTAAKASWWINSIKQGTDGALALGICRHLIDTGKHKTEYLRRSHKTAPNPDGSAGWTDAALLVNTTTRKFVTAKDANLLQFVAHLAAPIAASAAPSSTAPLAVALLKPDGTPADLGAWPALGNVKIGSELLYYASKAGSTLNVTARKCKGTSAPSTDHASNAEVVIPYVICVGGVLLGYHEAAEPAPGKADLEFTGTLGTDEIKTSFTLLKESLDTVANYATACGVAQSDIETLANEFAAASAPCADFYRGAVSNTNGFYTARAIHLINILLDRIDRKGGFAVSKRYGAGTPAHPNAPKPTGVRIDRAASKYEGVPALPTRPWYPLGYSGVQPEVWPSVKTGYPYPIKALITFTSNPAYSTPFNHVAIAALRDRTAVPLHVAVDIFMSETSALADYVFPDVTYLEKWAGNVLTGYAAVHTPAGTVRQPVVGSVDPVTRAYTPVLPNTRSMDDFLIALGKELGLPGYGTDGMGAGKHLNQSWDYYNEMYKSGDLAMTNGLADPSDPVLAMGGKRKSPAALYDTVNPGIIHADYKYGGLATIYSEWVASYKHSYTGQNFNGLPVFETPHRDSRGNPYSEGAGYPFVMINHKPVQHVQSRSTSNKWLQEIMPENGVWMHPGDAAARGIADGDLVRVRSPRYALTGRAQLTQGIQPGCISIPYSFGRWEHGARAYRVDGVSGPQDESVARGIASNPLVVPDPILGDVCFIDPVGGNAEFYSTRVAVEKA